MSKSYNYYLLRLLIPQTLFDRKTKFAFISSTNAIFSYDWIFVLFVMNFKFNVQFLNKIKIHTSATLLMATSMKLMSTML